MNSFLSKNIGKFIFFIIIFLALWFRTVGTNWDQGHHLHPDERFLTMVTTAIKWPKTLNEYLDTDSSPLNPHNNGFGFFVYGTFPLFFTKIVAETLEKGDYGNLTLVGRTLSALFDTGTVILTFLITKELVSAGKRKKEKSKSVQFRQFIIQTENIAPLLAMFIYACMVLPIQLSHFYAVDTYLVFFTTSAFYLIILIIKSFASFPKSIKQYLKPLMLSFLIGITIALALASKISAMLILPSLLSLLFYLLIKHKTFLPVLTVSAVMLISSVLSFRIFQPYTFSEADLFSFKLNPKFISNMNELKGMDNPDSTFPPAIQWRNRTPLIFPLRSFFLHGAGIPIGILTLVFLIFTAITTFRLIAQNIIKRITPAKIPAQNIFLLLSLIYIFTVFIYQGTLYTMNMRYFAMIYPILTIVFAYLASLLLPKISKKLYFIPSGVSFSIFILLIIFWPVSFTAIYQRPHSRVTASEWIYNNIPPGSTISYEVWDDPLPLHLPDGKTPDRYRFVELPMYDPDVYEKWLKVQKSLNNVDYIIMSSNRLWESIPRVPSLYPLASEYYKNLMNGELGFEKIAEIASYPCFPSASRCLLTINDSSAEESFTVYDHPKILIYRKINLNMDNINNWLKKSLQNQL